MMHVEIKRARPILTVVANNKEYEYVVRYWEVTGEYRKSKDACACENKPFTKDIRVGERTRMKVNKVYLKELCEKELESLINS